MKTVVFDLDGTLADTSGDLLAAANSCFRDLGHGDLLTTADALTALHGGRAMLRLGFSRLDAGVDEAEVDRQYPRLLAHYAQAIAVHTKLYPGVMAAVERLKSAGYITSICTNKPSGLAESLTRQLGIRDMFGALIGADSLPTRKPDPAPYQAAVRQAGGDPALSLLIGDTVIDRDTARAVGVPIILVSFGPEGAGVARLEPDALLHHYDDLPVLVDRLLG